MLICLKNIYRQKVEPSKALCRFSRHDLSTIHFRHLEDTHMEIFVPRRQVYVIKGHLMQFDYEIVDDYSPTAMMVKRGKVTRAEQRVGKVFCVHREMLRDSNLNKCNPAVATW